MEMVLSMAWTLGLPPDVLLDMDAGDFELFAAYCQGRSKGEAIASKRRWGRRWRR